MRSFVPKSSFSFLKLLSLQFGSNLLKLGFSLPLAQFAIPQAYVDRLRVFAASLDARREKAWWHMWNWKVVLVSGLLLGGYETAAAQPSRQLPVLSQFMKQTPPPPPANQRVRPAPNQVGFETTDFYPKQGYPRFLGDAVDAAQGSAQGSGQLGQSGQVGTIGQFGQFGGGFQGNTGNQIGQNSGGTIFGGIFGGGGGGGGGGRPGGGLVNPGGVTGGGFTGGAMPKGFGFGGTPER
jgi:hypothetical protein